MAEIAIKTNHSAVSLHSCCNDILYLNVPVLRINGKNQISMWWDMSDLHWKVGFAPRKTEHAPHYRQASWSGANKNSEHGRPLGVKLRACQSWGPCSIHILLHPFFWLSQPPLAATPIFWTRLAWHISFNAFFTSMFVCELWYWCKQNRVIIRSINSTHPNDTKVGSP